CQQYSKLPRTF
nr:immunoglobulin light chain junction region [Mus musculus]